MSTPTRVRWQVGALLLASTVINYIDRQTLSVLGPYLKTDFHWRNEQFALIVIAFRVAYALGQAVNGRLLDRLGARLGLTLSVAWYSMASLLTPLAQGLWSLCLFRFLLGWGEAGNWPGATKAVGEWFPKRERAWAVALFDSGSAVGAAVAPMLVLWMYHRAGSWRAAFVLPGLLGIIWLVVWNRFYRSPEEHPRINDAERNLILSDRDEGRGSDAPASWAALLRQKRTWGIVLGRALTDPVWYFITDWFAIFLASRGGRLEESILAFWIPFLSADVGNFLGGGVSSWLVRKGWPVLRARKAVIVVTGLGMAMLAGSVALTNAYTLALLFGVSTCSYAAWSTMALTLPADLYPQHQVASVSGLTGAGSGLGVILSTWLIGWTADHFSFAPVLVAASLIPLAATALVLLLVREQEAV